MDVSTMRALKRALARADEEPVWYPPLGTGPGSMIPMKEALRLRERKRKWREGGAKGLSRCR